MIEIWREIPGLPYNMASSLGRIKSLDKPVNNGYGTICIKRGVVLKPFKAKSGYLTVSITYPDNKRRTTKVHRLIAFSFIGFPKDFEEVNHKDRNKQNNVPENLEWVTKSVNCIHRDSALIKSTSISTSKKVKIENLETSEITFFNSIREASRYFKVDHISVSRSIKKKYKFNKVFKAYEQ